MPTLTQPFAVPVAVQPMHYDSQFPLMFGGNGAWQAYKYETVRSVLFDCESFSNAYMPKDPDYILGSNLNQTDPPLHPKLRGLVAGPFTKTAISALRPEIELQVNALLAALLDKGEMDAASDFAFPLSAGVIGAVIGIPCQDRSQVKDWAKAVVSAGYVEDGLQKAAVAQKEMFLFFCELLAQKSAAPKDDLLTSLQQAELDREPLALPLKVASLMTLLLAGFETSASLLISCLQALTELTDWQQKLRGEPELATHFIGEVLRLRPPLASMYRKAKSDTRLEGQLIKEGEIINAWICTANRDGSVFANPGAFNPSRPGLERSLSFGYGLHHCVGDQLAKAEVSIALASLLDKVADIALQPGTSPIVGPSMIVSGFETLPITFKIS